MKKTTRGEIGNCKNIYFSTSRIIWDCFEIIVDLCNWKFKEFQLWLKSLANFYSVGDKFMKLIKLM